MVAINAVINSIARSENRLKFRISSTPNSVPLKADNVNVHRAAAKVIVSKSRAARGSVCNELLSDVFATRLRFEVGSVLAPFVLVIWHSPSPTIANQVKSSEQVGVQVLNYQIDLPGGKPRHQSYGANYV